MQPVRDRKKAFLWRKQNGIQPRRGSVGPEGPTLPTRSQDPDVEQLLQSTVHYDEITESDSLDWLQSTTEASAYIEQPAEGKTVEDFV